MRSKLCLLSGIAFLLAILATPIAARADCTTFANSHAEDSRLGDGPVCVGTGAGCVECVNRGPNGFSVCIRDWSWDFYGCFTYGNPPENMGF